MRFIHIADVHLGRCPENKHDWGRGRSEELWESVAAVIDACNEKHIELLLIAGDLFDHIPVWEDLERINRLFSALRETEVVLIAGDRDYVSSDSAWKEFPWKDWVHVLLGKEPESVFLEHLDALITGCSYDSAEESQPYLMQAKIDDDTEIQILIGHTGDDRHMPADLEQLSKQGFDYLALGHVHQPKLFPEQKAAYAGSLEPLDKTEIGKHGFVLGEINAGETKLKFIPFACREYINLKVRLSSDVTQEELEERLLQAMKKSGERNLFQLQLEGSFQPGKKLDAKRLMELGNVTELVDQTTPDYNLVSLMAEHKDDVIGMYLEEFLRSPAGNIQQKALYCGLEALLLGDSAKPEA